MPGSKKSVLKYYENIKNQARFFSAALQGMAKVLSRLNKKQFAKIVDGFLTKVYNYIYDKNQLTRFANILLTKETDIKKFYI